MAREIGRSLVAAFLAAALCALPITAIEIFSLTLNVAPIAWISGAIGALLANSVGLLLLTSAVALTWLVVGRANDWRGIRTVSAFGALLGIVARVLAESLPLPMAPDIEGHDVYFVRQTMLALALGYIAAAGSGAIVGAVWWALRRPDRDQPPNVTSA